MLIGNMWRHAKATRKRRSSLEKPQKDENGGQGGGRKDFDQFVLKMGKKKEKFSSRLVCQMTYIISHGEASIVRCHR